MVKRILIDATNVNISIPGGGSYCTKAYIEALLALFPSQIDVLHPEQAHIRDVRYHTIDVPVRNRLQRILGVTKGQFHRGAPFLVNYIEKYPDRYHTVFISTGLYAGSMISKIQKMGIRVIVLHHNFEPEFRMDSKNILTLKGKTDTLVRYWERRGYREADINLFLTEQDRILFEKSYGSHPHNYVSGVFEPTMEHQELSLPTNNHSAVITCALGEIQNQAPLLRFAEHYLPVFEKTLPDWKIRLMGRTPSDTILDIAEKHDTILLIPNPEDIRALAAESAIYLCPMDAGGGLKLRIMDGLRAGQPILTHVRSARGYDALFQQPWFCIYEDTDSFRQGLEHIVRYINSKDYSRSQIQAQYYALFGLTAGIERLKAILCP